MIYIVTGQTATGKTQKAIELAKHHDGEIINFDARQIYKKLDIITGKDLDLTTRKFISTQSENNFDIGYYELQATNNDPTTKLWLYDIVDPRLPFSSQDFQELAMIVIQNIFGRNKTPILVGGTYFYLKHLLYDMLTYHVRPNWELREELNNKNVTELQSMVKKMNPSFFANLNDSEKQNPQRLVRKIELLTSSNQIDQEGRINIFHFNDFFKKNEISMIGLHHKNTDLLFDRITERVQKRIDAGAIDEVTHLLESGYTKTDPGLKTIGYSQCIDFLQDISSKEELKTIWIRREIQYAKRQYTFMKKDPHIKWIAV